MIISVGPGKLHLHTLMVYKGQVHVGVNSPRVTVVLPRPDLA